MDELLNTIYPELIKALSIIMVALSSYLVKKLSDFISTLAAKHKLEIDSNDMAQLTKDLDSLVQSAIIATNQTYVNELKKSGQFTNKEYQKAAVTKALECCNSMMTKELKSKLEQYYPDLDKLLRNRIEYLIGLSKEDTNGGVNNGNGASNSEN